MLLQQVCEHYYRYNQKVKQFLKRSIYFSNSNNKNHRLFLILPAGLPPPDRLALRYLAVVVGVLLYEADGRLLRPVRVAAVVVLPAGLPGEDLLQPGGGPRQAGAPALAAGGRAVVAGAARLAEAADRELRGLAEEGGVGGEGALEPEEVVLCGAGGGKY